MAISLTAKVDFLFKKLGFGVARTDSDSIKGATNESIASPLLNRGDKTWVQASLIPATLPGSDTSIVRVYGSNSLVKAVADGTASANRTWLTGATDWIPPEFGATYQVKVYLAADSDGAAVIANQLFAAGSGNDDEWFFDYQAGVLHFMGENLPNGEDFSGKSIYISGGRYIGTIGVSSAGFDSDQVVEIIRENGLRVLEIPSDSDLKVVADLSNNVTSITARLDSDSSMIQALATTVKSRLDSDSLVIQALRSDISLIKQVLDSDDAAIQLAATTGGSSSASDSDLTVLDNKIIALTEEVNNLKAILGVTAPKTPATPTPTDSENLAQVTFVTDSDSRLEGQMNVTWRVLSGDGSTVASNTVIFAKGSLDTNVLGILTYNIETHPVGKDFFETVVFREQKLEYAFKEKFSLAEYKLTFTINSHGGDNPVFTTTLPTSS